MKRWHISLLLILALLIAAWSLIRDNFHEVIPGELYRSAQLSGSELKRVVRENGIRTVINMRLPSPERKWYRDELAAVAELQVKYISMGMYQSAPRVDQILELHEVLETVERPVLVHCIAGVDRTGLAVVMALLMGESQNLDKIQEQLSLRYGVWREDSMGKVFLAGYRKWLAQNGEEHSAAALRHWLDTDYLDPSGNVHFLVHAIEGQVWERPFGLYEKGMKFKIKRSENTHLELDGWAFDTRNTSLLAGLEVSLGDVPMAEVNYQIFSPWLIDDFGREEYLYSGWSANHPLEDLADGCHDLLFTFHKLDGSSWASPPAGRICID